MYSPEEEVCVSQVPKSETLQQSYAGVTGVRKKGERESNVCLESVTKVFNLSQEFSLPLPHNSYSFPQKC